VVILVPFLDKRLIHFVVVFFLMFNVYLTKRSLRIEKTKKRKRNEKLIIKLKDKNNLNFVRLLKIFSSFLKVGFWCVCYT